MNDKIIDEELKLFSVGHKADIFEFDEITYPNKVVIKSKLTNEKYIMYNDPKYMSMMPFAEIPTEYYAFIQQVKLHKIFDELPNIIIRFSPKWFYDMNNTCPESISIYWWLIKDFLGNDYLEVHEYIHNEIFYPIDKNYDETVADLTNKGFIVKEIQ